MSNEAETCRKYLLPKLIETGNTLLSLPDTKHYCSPDELKKAVDQTIAAYNSTPHESLDNASPNEVYAGRKEAILQRRKEKKQLTL